MNDYSREQIRRRMLRRVSMLWDIPDIEYADPLVKLMVEAMAEEIFMLAGEMDDLDERLLSKLTAAMTPAVALAAHPAHAILHVTPATPTESIGHETVFEYKDSRLLRKYNLNRLCFTPVAPFELVRARIRFINIGGRLYEYGGDNRKSTVGVPEKQTPAFNNVVWLGIDADPEIRRMDNVSFYFDFANAEDKYRYIQILPHTRWTLGDKELEIRPGLRREQTADSDGHVFGKDAVNQVFAGLQAHYDPHYITVTEITAEQPENAPAEWAGSYPEHTLSRLSTPLLWIKIRFPDSVPFEMLEYLQAGINLFPVANMSRRTLSQKMTDLSVFTLLDTDTNEYFMEVGSVRDSLGKIYEALPSGDIPGGSPSRGTYSIRRGGVEQYSRTTDTASTLLRLTDIVRDRHLFSNGRADREFNQTVNNMVAMNEQLAGAAKALPRKTEPRSYIVIDKGTPGETLFVDYWVTAGDVVNGFRSSVPLSAAENTTAFEEAIHFYTPLRGGCGSPSTEKIRDVHRYMLSSRNRIITECDILNFCRAEYGEYISKIEVRPGACVGVNPGQGLVRTKDIHIAIDTERACGLPEEDFKLELLNKLRKRSPESFNYRIFIDNE